MKYLIVGGVAGGASTVARLRRLDEHSEIVMFEKGAYISYANCGLPGIGKQCAIHLIITTDNFTRFDMPIILLVMQVLHLLKTNQVKL